MSDKKKVMREVNRIEMDTIGRIASVARKAGIPRNEITAQVERLNREYFSKVMGVFTSSIEKSE